MSTETPTILPDLLNRVEAIIDCGAATATELGQFLLPDQDKRQSGIRVSEWIRSRKKSPNGEIALRMKEWCARKELEIMQKRMATKYRTAYRGVLNKRVVKA